MSSQLPKMPNVLTSLTLFTCCLIAMLMMSTDVNARSLLPPVQTIESAKATDRKSSTTTATNAIATVRSAGKAASRARMNPEATNDDDRSTADRMTHAVLITSTRNTTSSNTSSINTSSIAASARTAGMPGWCPAPDSCAPDLAHKLASNQPAKSAITAGDVMFKVIETITKAAVALTVDNPLVGPAVAVMFGLTSAFTPATDTSCDKACLWDSIGSVVKEVIGEAVDASQISNRYSKLDGVIQEINTQYVVANSLKEQYPDKDFCCVAQDGDHCKNPLPTTQSPGQVASPNQMWCNVASALTTIRQTLIDDEHYYNSVPAPNGINSLVQYFSIRIALEISMFLFSDPMFIPTASCIKFGSKYSNMPLGLSVDIYCDTNEGWRDYIMFGMIDPYTDYIRSAVADAKAQRMDKIQTLVGKASPNCGGIAQTYSCYSVHQRTRVLDNGCGASGTGTWDMIVPRGTCTEFCLLCTYLDSCIWYDDSSAVADRNEQSALVCKSDHEDYVIKQQIQSWNTLALDTVGRWQDVRSAMSQWGPWVICTAADNDYCDGRYITCTPPVMHDAQHQSTGISCDPAAQPNALCYPGNGLPCCNTQTVPSYVGYHANYPTGAWMC